MVSRSEAQTRPDREDTDVRTTTLNSVKMTAFSDTALSSVVKVDCIHRHPDNGRSRHL
jgi:hypothetical protein